MNLRRALTFVALCALLVGSACGRDGGITAPAATVNDREIDRSEFERELEALRDNDQLREAVGEALTGTGQETVSSALAAGWLTAVIYDAVIADVLDERDVEVTDSDRAEGEAELGTQFGNPEVAQEFPDWFRERLIARNARAVALRDDVAGFSSSEEDLRRYYEEHRDEFTVACLSHVLVETEAEAQAAVDRLERGEAFASVARDLSQDPGSASRGGDLDCGPTSLFVEEFARAANEAEIGEPTEPVQTSFGYHVLLVRERRPAPFDEVRTEAKTALNRERQEGFEDFLGEAVEQAEVTVDPRYGRFEAVQPGRPPQVVPPEPPAPAEGRATTTTGLPLAPPLLDEEFEEPGVGTPPPEG